MKDTFEILSDIADERARQDAKWGVQNWDHVRPEVVPVMEKLVVAAKSECERLANGGRLSWFDILLEEFYEAFAETDVDRQIEELTQVAAVAVAAIESLERRRNGIIVQKGKPDVAV